jgi:putative holliday junction resolvase
MVLVRPREKPITEKGDVSRTLGIDYGRRRIGLALSDPTRTIASPLTTLTRRGGKRPPWPELKRLIQEHEIEDVVLGLPLGLDGEENPWTAEVRDFAFELTRRTGLPVRLVDERMSSVIAERAVRGIGLKRSQREEKHRVDSAAAAVLLRHYLALKDGERADHAT